MIQCLTILNIVASAEDDLAKTLTRPGVLRCPQKEGLLADAEQEALDYLRHIFAGEMYDDDRLPELKAILERWGSHPSENIRTIIAQVKEHFYSS